MPHCPVSPLPFSDYNYVIDVITRKSISFSFSFKKQNWYYTSSEFVCSLQLHTYRNTIIIIDYLNCYYNWWQLAWENPYGYSMCCLRTYCVFSLFSIFILSQCTLYCNAICQIKYYHTVPCRAVPCRAVPCRAVPYYILYTIYYILYTSHALSLEALALVIYTV